MANETTLVHERERFCRTRGDVFMLNESERSLGEFHLQYSSRKNRYERGDRDKGHYSNLDGWESGTFYHRNACPRSIVDSGYVDPMSLVSWKFDFGAYGIDSGKVKCLADDSVRWRLFTRKEHSGNAWSVEWFGGTKSLSDIRGASFIILTAMFPNHDPRLGAPKLLVEEKNACHVFKVTVQLKRKTHTVDKANDFSVAAMNNDLGTMEQMLQKDYNPEDLKELNSEGDTALHVAFRCRSDDAGVYMLKKCPELRNYKNRFNEEPLDIASKKMQRLANYRFTDTEVQVSDYEKQSVGYNLRNDRDFGDDAIGHKIYAKSLANALYSSKLQTPLTVGLFAPWGSGKTFLLKLLLKILKGMQKKYNKTKSTCWNEFKLFLHIVFFLPPPPTYFEETDEMDFIIVNFNAWEYAGSDSLWAGIVTNLVSKIETYAGYWKTRFFRIVAKPKEVAKVPPTKQNKAANLKLRKTTLIVKLPNFVWLGLFLLLLVAAIVLAVLIATGELRVEYPSNSTGNATDEVQSSEGSAKDTLIAIQACITSVLGGTVFLNIKSIGKGIMTFVNSQKDKIEKMVNKPDFSSKLGFMSEIKNEVVIASALINWISSYKKKPIRVIITVDDLDRCPKKKAVKVIEAMNILLSDEFSPFICILAVDSRIIVEAIEESLGKVATNAYLTGHEYLKKFLQVPFCIPAMSLSSKEKFMRKLKEEASSSNDDNEDDFYGIGWQDRETEEPEKATKYSCCCNAKVEDDDKIQLKVESQFNYELNKDDSYMEDLLKEFAKIEILQYLAGNPRHIKRIFNLLCITAHLVKVSGGPKFLPKEIVMWTVLLDQWPYRTTYIIHYIEDFFQRQELGMEVAWDGLTHMTTLKEIYPKVKGDFNKPNDWEMLISLDGDPELMQRYLNTEMRDFDVRNVQQIIPYTIHLDRSIRYSIAHAQTLTDIERSPDQSPCTMCNINSKLNSRLDDLCDNLGY